MRMMFPGVRERRTVDRLLTTFFREHRELDFRRGIGLLGRFYHLPRPRVRWFEYLDWGKTAGRTYENGDIHLVHPESWKRGRKYNSERQWILVRGVIRPSDLGPANSIRSEKIAGFEIRVNGKGVVGDAIRRPNFLYRLILGLLPF